MNGFNHTVRISRKPLVSNICNIQSKIIWKELKFFHFILWKEFIYAIDLKASHVNSHVTKCTCSNAVTQGPQKMNYLFIWM